ncbi:Crp/Fnr family transcriptional regulator [Paenibacillus thermoaerophilus]|nr:Crp/Fnr family transcriptional regulator [Paenibacillus thermoaerophilus]
MTDKRQPPDFPRNTSLFSSGSLSKLQEIMYTRHVPAGGKIFWEGDPADKLYFVREGSVKLTKLTDEGKQIIVSMYMAGDLFGQIEPYRQSLRAFGAEAAEPSSLGVMQQRDLEVLLWKHGDLAVEFMRWMGLMHRQTQTKFRDLMLFGKPGALCSLLVRLGNCWGEERDGHIRIRRKLTHGELGEMIGSTRESVNRMLGEFKKLGVLDIEDGYLILKDTAYLRDICHCEDCPRHICRI